MPAHCPECNSDDITTGVNGLTEDLTPVQGNLCESCGLMFGTEER